MSSSFLHILFEKHILDWIIYLSSTASSLVPILRSPVLSLLTAMPLSDPDIYTDTQCFLFNEARTTLNIPVVVSNPILRSLFNICNNTEPFSYSMWRNFFFFKGRMWSAVGSNHIDI